MIKVRRWYDDSYTLGRLRVGDFQCFTLELPDLDNQKNVSCIPEGEYSYFLRNSPKNGKVLELKSVTGRSNIQIHSGNFTRQIRGCLLVGDSIKHIDRDDIPDISNSRNTLIKLLHEAGDSGIISIRG